MKYKDEEGQERECSCPEGSHSEIHPRHSHGSESYAEMQARVEREQIEKEELPENVSPANPLSKENSPMNEVPAPATPVTENPMAVAIDAMVMQLQSALDTVKAPDYVRKAAEGLIDALKLWASGGGPNAS